MNLSLLCLLGWAPCHHEAALRLPDPSCVTSDQARAQGSQAPVWLYPSVWTPLQGEVLGTKTPLLAPDFPAQRQDNVCCLQNYKRDVEIIKGEGRGQLPSLCLTWKRGTQMPNCGRYSSSSSICLLGSHFRQVVWGALQLPLGLSRGSVNVPYLAGLSRQELICFNSPLNPRNSIYFAPFFPILYIACQVIFRCHPGFLPFQRENDDFLPDCLPPLPKFFIPSINCLHWSHWKDAPHQR